MILNWISTGNRVMLGYVLVIILLMGGAGYGAWHLTQQTQNAKTAVVDAQVLVSRLHHMKSKVLLMEAELQDVIFAHRKEDVDAAQARVGKHQKALEKALSELEGLPEEGAKEIRTLVGA